MNRLDFKAVAFRLSGFLTFPYLAGVVYSLIFQEYAMHQAGSILPGPGESILYGICMALVSLLSVTSPR